MSIAQLLSTTNIMNQTSNTNNQTTNILNLQALGVGVPVPGGGVNPVTGSPTGGPNAAPALTPQQANAAHAAQAASKLQLANSNRNMSLNNLVNSKRSSNRFPLIKWKVDFDQGVLIRESKELTSMEVNKKDGDGPWMLNRNEIVEQVGE